MRRWLGVLLWALFAGVLLLIPITLVLGLVFAFVLTIRTAWYF